MGDTKNPKAYTADLGSKNKQFWGSTWNGLMHVEHINSVGPKAQNGGEMILEQGERCAVTLAFLPLSVSGTGTFEEHRATQGPGHEVWLADRHCAKSQMVRVCSSTGWRTHPTTLIWNTSPRLLAQIIFP